MAGDPEQETAYRAGDLRLFESGLFSDIVVECGPRSWNLHKNILCTRSVWFETAITGSYVVGQMKSQQEAFDGVIRIKEQDPEAVEVCLRYIYGGAINMATETRFRPVFKFCAELYRSADFFLLKPLLPVVQRHLGDYCDEKTRWMWTRGNMTEDERNEKKALVWVADLKAAILETNKWNTPVVNVVLMEFVWASKTSFTTYYPTYLNMRDWLRQNVRRFWDEMEDRCDTTPRPTIWCGRRKPSPSPVWTPPSCKTPVSVAWLRCDICVRCGSRLEKGDCNEKAYGQLRDPFNSSDGCTYLREWCVECAAEIKYPWREDGYL